MSIEIKHGPLSLELRDEGYAVMSCELNIERVEIPAVINGTCVYRIEDHAFECQERLSEVVFLSPGVDEYGIATEIELGFNAFSFCTSLEEIDLRGRVGSVGWSCFINCTSLKRVLIDRSTFLEPYAFAHCESLVEISPLNFISEAAFSHCKSLTYLPISDTAETVDEDAFEHCDALSEVTVPASLRRLGKLVFRGCYGLTRVTFSEPCGWYFTNEYMDREYALDLSDPEKNAKRLRSADFDDGNSDWYRK